MSEIISFSTFSVNRKGISTLLSISMLMNLFKENEKLLRFNDQIFYISTWNVSTEEEDYDYFMEFVGTVANLTLDNFHTLYDYEDDERLENIDFRELVEFVNDFLSDFISNDNQ